MTSEFQNNCRLHLLHSKNRTSANVFNNGVNAGLILSSHKGTTSKRYSTE